MLNTLDKKLEELKTVEISRQAHLAEKVVIVDGQPGCGKTLFSPIIAALERVELLTYAYELEYICSLKHLGKIADDAALSMVGLLTDLQVYNTMMGRETNFRPTDLSSVFMDANPWRYFKRIFQAGDEATPARIETQKPILHLTTHNLLGMSDPVLRKLGERLVFVEIVRHPLYMFKQQRLNFYNAIDTVRDFTVYYQQGEKEVPFWTHGWGDLYVKSNGAEKAIYGMKFMSQLTEGLKKVFEEKYSARLITISFEQFVIDPEPHLDKICEALGTRVTPMTRRVLKKQNVPRQKYAEGINLPVYKRCGWVPAQKDASEEDELQARWKLAAEDASDEALSELEKLCIAYEEKYLGGKLNYAKD